MALLDRIAEVVGPGHVLAGESAEPWARDWTGAYKEAPLTVLRPASTAEVGHALALATPPERRSCRPRGARA